MKFAKKKTQVYIIHLKLWEWNINFKIVQFFWGVYTEFTGFSYFFARYFETHCPWEIFEIFLDTSI